MSDLGNIFGDLWCIRYRVGCSRCSFSRGRMNVNFHWGEVPTYPTPSTAAWNCPRKRNNEARSSRSACGRVSVEWVQVVAKEATSASFDKVTSSKFGASKCQEHWHTMLVHAGGSRLQPEGKYTEVSHEKRTGKCWCLPFACHGMAAARGWSVLGLVLPDIPLPNTGKTVLIYNSKITAFVWIKTSNSSNFWYQKHTCLCFNQTESMLNSCLNVICWKLELDA